jgi:hypothetical protein
LAGLTCGQRALRTCSNAVTALVLPDGLGFERDEYLRSWGRSASSSVWGRWQRCPAQRLRRANTAGSGGPEIAGLESAGSGVAFRLYCDKPEPAPRLEPGRSNSIRNLWPEAALPEPGFHEKDKIENDLHRQVCASKDRAKCHAASRPRAARSSSVKGEGR